MQKVDYTSAEKIGVQPKELDFIKSLLGRLPNWTELNVYSVMWSEAISGKRTLQYFGELPREGKHSLPLHGKGKHSSLLDIGNGQACTLRIGEHSSHQASHCCGKERDVSSVNKAVFAMGARPIAQLSTLYVNNSQALNVYPLLKDAVKELADYTNIMGIPMVSSDISLNESTRTVPLVNVLSVGLMQKDAIGEPTSLVEGDSVYLIGLATRRNKAGKSSTAKEEEPSLVPIKTGDPFTGKLLLEALLELRETGCPHEVQEVNKAGIVAAMTQLATAIVGGFKIDLTKVPLLEDDMTPCEILLSESPDRMIVVIEKAKGRIAEAIFDKWDLPYAKIGEVIAEHHLTIRHHHISVVNIPIDSLLAVDLVGRSKQPSAPFHPSPKQDQFNIDSIPEPKDLRKVAVSLISSPALASKQWIYEQYDSMVQTLNMRTNMPSDAAIVNIKGTPKALAVSMAGNARYMKEDPKTGAMIAVAAASRKVVCSGGDPCGVTVCLNFGDQNNPEEHWKLMQAIKGIDEVCEKLSFPLLQEDVSFVIPSHSEQESLCPIVTVGLVGLLDKRHQMSSAFRQKGDMIYLIGRSRNDISSSEYLYGYCGVTVSPAPYFKLEEELDIQAVVDDLIQHNLLQSAHEVSKGGLFVALLESASFGNFGFDITSDAEIRSDAFLFGESQSRIVISVAASREVSFVDYMAKNNKHIPISTLGHVTKSEVRVDDVSFGFIKDLKRPLIK